MKTIEKGKNRLQSGPRKPEPSPEAGCETKIPAVVGHIEQRLVDQLGVFDNNARTHTADQIHQIAASIREFGFVNPILIGPDDTIIAGHARLLAARELGMISVPVIILEHLSEPQRGALVIAGNQLALTAGWEKEMLRREVAVLREQRFDLELLGFDDREINRMLSTKTEPLELRDPNATPRLQQVPATVPGDLWLLGEHRLLCGDSNRPEDIDKVLAGEQADMVFTDLPSNDERTHLERTSGSSPGDAFQRLLE